MATTFNNTLRSELGISETSVLTSAANARVTVIGLSLTNLTGSVILASIRVLNNVNSDTAYYLKEVPIPPNQSLRVINGGEKLVLGADTSLFVQASQNDSLDLVMSYVSIT
jgi:hypothetical protein